MSNFRSKAMSVAEGQEVFAKSIAPVQRKLDALNRKVELVKEIDLAALKAERKLTNQRIEHLESVVSELMRRL